MVSIQVYFILLPFYQTVYFLLSLLSTVKLNCPLGAVTQKCVLFWDK